MQRAKSIKGFTSIQPARRTTSSYKSKASAEGFFILPLLLLFAGFLIQAATGAEGFPLVWDRSAVAYSIGNGQATSEDVLVRFTSPACLTNVQIRVAPGLAGFVAATPSIFPQVLPNVPCTVKLRFSVPPQTHPGTRSGTIHLVSGKRTAGKPLPVSVKIDYGDIVISPATRVLSPAAAELLTSISAEGSVLSFSGASAELTSLRPGDTLVIGVSSATPMGLLRKVLSVEPLPTGISVLTGPAALDEAISAGTITLSKALSSAEAGVAISVSPGVALRHPLPADPANGLCLEMNGVVLYDQDGNPETGGDQITVNGSLAMAPGFDFSLILDKALHVRQARLVSTVREALQLELASGCALAGFDQQAELGRYTFAPLVVWAGYVPVVFVPVLSANAGAAGDVSAGTVTGFQQSATIQAGVSYEAGQVSPVADCRSDCTWASPAVCGDCAVKAWAGPELKLLIYGAVSSHADTHGYLELSADLLGTPWWWELYGGLEASVGIRAEPLSEEMADIDVPGVVDERVLLGHSAEAHPGYLAGSVADAVTRAPLAGVSIEVYSPSGKVSQGVTTENGAYLLALRPGTGYSLCFSKASYLPLSYYNVSATCGETNCLEPVLQIEECYAQCGSASGFVLDAVSGAGVANLMLELRCGMNARSGPVLAMAPTTRTGGYQFTNIPGGTYTVEAAAPGYLTTYFTIYVLGGRNTLNQNATLTPAVPAGELRMVLTWGASPDDLDSHLTGPLPDGTRFHVYYPYAQATSGSPWPDYVTLDVDAVGGYGPETTTLLQQLPGTYRFSVQDYSNRASTNSTALADSGAQVQVYSVRGLSAVFNVPTGQGGTLWTVFELNGGVITPGNTLSYQCTPAGMVSAPRPGTGQEIDWKSLPAKATAR